MPAVYVTLDYMDGRSQIKGPLYPDEIDLTGLLFRLNESELATVTFTRARPLDPLLKPMPWCEHCRSYHSSTTPHIKPEHHNGTTENKSPERDDAV